MPARVRLNMKRSPLESQVDRPKQRRVMEDPDEDEVMIGEVQVNEEVEHPTPEVSVTEFDDWQQKECERILRELQSQNGHDAGASSRHGSGAVIRFALVSERGQCLLWILDTWENRRASMEHRKGITTSGDSSSSRTSQLLTHASETLLTTRRKEQRHTC